MTETAPCGSWRSPITAGLITAQFLGLDYAAIDGQDLYWTESRPLEGGRYALMRRAPGARPAEVLPADCNVRTRVHEYGGAAFAVFDGTVYFASYKDQRLHRQAPGGKPQPFSSTEGYRYADLVLDRPHRRLIGVREDHTRPGQPVNTLVALPLTGGDGSVLVEGHDFFSSPRLSPDGRHLAWLCWDHPNMPWDGCELWSAELLPEGSLGAPRRVAGRPDESIFQPEWSPDGVLHFVSDRSGWWNLYRDLGQVEALCPMPAEFGRPQWAFGMRTYGFLSDSEILCSYRQDGRGRLARLDLSTKTLQPLDLPFTEFDAVVATPELVVLKAGSASMPLALLTLDLRTGRTEVVRRAFEPTVDPGFFSTPEPVEFPTGGGLSARGFFYPPANPDFSVPAGELPPLLVMSHGGPTDSATTLLRYSLQYWTSRGFAVLDVDYGGSSGYGRLYRQRLNDAWGIVDVDDCCNGARWLAQQGRVDGKRMAIRGGSAGGYTTLAALTFRQVFSAGASHYGIGDLEVLARDTHKFESHYTDSLVGPYPARKDLYHDRSPIHFVERMSAPLILFQGDEDPVVPPEQARSMYAAVKAKGLPVAFLLFKGEQHGFRQAGNIQRSYEAELYFYSRVFRFPLTEPIEPVAIENLPA